METELAGGNESLRFERLLLELSTSFINVPAVALDTAIESGLRRIVEFLDIDRSTLSVVSPDTGHFNATHSWARPGLSPVSSNVSSRTFPWVLAQMRAGKPILFTRPEELPPEAARDRQQYIDIGLRSHVALPLIAGGELMGVLGFGALGEERRWPAHFVQRLRLVGDIFASTLARGRANAELNQARGFEQLAARILSGLLVSDAAAEDRVIADALRDIGDFLALDRVALWLRTPGQREFRSMHRWVGPKESSTPEALGGGDIPWLSGCLIARKEVAFKHVGELPGEAASDLPALHEIRIKSALIMPLSVHGDVVGAFSLISTRGERTWPEAITEGARLLAQVFASLLARQSASRDAERDRIALRHVTRVSMLGELSASIAHQLNQPLAAILGNAEAAQQMLKRGNVDMVELREICDDIVFEDHRAAEVIRRLGALFKRGEMTMRPLDLNELIRDTIELLRTELVLRQVVVATELDPALPLIEGGDVQLQQVILNLIVNGADAMAALAVSARKLTLRTECIGERVKLYVEDRGPGIAPDDLKRIFEAFWSTKPGGMGIGLAICQSIAAAHGGQIVASNNAHGGATFCVTLPARRPQ